MIDFTPDGTELRRANGRFSRVISGLDAATSYDFQFVAQNWKTGATPGPSHTNCGQQPCQWSPNSPVVSASTLPDLPTAPVSLTATAGRTTMMLGWSPPASGAVTSYRLRYRATETGVWGRWFDPATSPGQLPTGYTVQNLVNGVEYQFELTAQNRAGNGPAATVTASTTADLLPTRPWQLKAIGEDQAVTLSWVEPKSPEVAATGYQTRYAKDADWVFGAWSDITVSKASLWPGSPYYRVTSRVTGLTNGVRYVFDVRAVGAQGHSTTATVKGEPFAVAAVSGLTASPHRQVFVTADDVPTGWYGSVVLSWSPVSAGSADRYEYRVRYTDSTDSTKNRAYTAWTRMWGVDGSATSHTVIFLPGTGTHTFQVRAVRLDAAGPASAEASSISLPAPPKPTHVSAVALDRSVRLAWSNPKPVECLAAREQGCEQERLRAKWRVRHRLATSQTWGAWVELSNARLDSYVVESLQNGSAYQFQVAAANIEGVWGPASHIVTATPRGAPAMPTGLAARRGAQQVALTWADPLDPFITGYEACYSTASGGCGATVDDWAPLNGSDASTVSHVVTNLPNGVTYWFFVRAVNSAGAGAASDGVAAAAGVPAKPGGFTATPDDGAVELNWNALGDPLVQKWQYRYRDAYTPGSSLGVKVRRRVNSRAPASNCEIVYSPSNDPACLASEAFEFSMPANRNGSSNPVPVDSVEASDADGGLPTYSLRSSESFGPVYMSAVRSGFEGLYTIDSDTWQATQVGTGEGGRDRLASRRVVHGVRRRRCAVEGRHPHRRHFGSRRLLALRGRRGPLPPAWRLTAASSTCTAPSTRRCTSSIQSPASQCR